MVVPDYSMELRRKHAFVAAHAAEEMPAAGKVNRCHDGGAIMTAGDQPER
jgi:hypothetical protein